MAGRVDSVVGVILAIGWTVGFKPQWGARNFLFLLLVWPSSLGAYKFFFIVRMAHCPGSTAVMAWS